MFPFSLITSQNLPFSKHKTRKARGDWQPALARPSAMCCHGRFPPRKPGACGLACACVCLPVCVSACLSETPTQQQSKPESQFISEGLITTRASDITSARHSELPEGTDIKGVHYISISTARQSDRFPRARPQAEDENLFSGKTFRGLQRHSNKTTAVSVTELGSQVSTIRCHTHLAKPTFLFKKRKKSNVSILRTVNFAICQEVYC